MNKDARFTDYQVLTLIKSYPKSSMSDLLRHAETEMPGFIWTIGKVQKALDRLHSRGKIDFEDGERMVRVHVKEVTAR